LAGRIKPAVFLTAGIFLVFSIQGCDRLTSFFDYFSPQKKQQEEARPASASPSEPSTPTPTPAPQTAAVPEPKTATNENVLVRIGDWSLTPEDFQNRLRAVKEAYPEYDISNSQQNSLLLEEMVRQQLLVEAAREAGLHQNPEIEEAVKEFRKTLLVQEVARQLTEGITVTDEEAQQYYEENKALMVEPTQWHVREIVVPDEQKAKDLMKQLLAENPPAFGELAQKESIAESSWQKGDLGLISEFPFSKMENAVMALEPGGISSVFAGPQGYYLAKLEEIQEGEAVAFEDVKEEIKEGLLLLKQQDAVLNRMVEMQDKVDFYINEELLQEQGL